MFRLSVHDIANVEQAGRLGERCVQNLEQEKESASLAGVERGRCSLDSHDRFITKVGLERYRFIPISEVMFSTIRKGLKCMFVLQGSGLPIKNHCSAKEDDEPSSLR